MNPQTWIQNELLRHANGGSDISQQGDSRKYVSNSICLCISCQKPTDKYTFTSRYIIHLKTDYQLLTIFSGFHLQSTYIIHSLLYASQQPCEVGRITPIWQMKWVIWAIFSQDGDAQIVTQVSENQFPVFSSFSSTQSKSLLSFPPTPLTLKKPPS